MGDFMKKKNLIFVSMLLILVLVFSSCSFIEGNMAYIDSADGAINTVYTASIIGLVLFLWGREF
jgi:hypothetical protein